jgi:hypothetical protein
MIPLGGKYCVMFTSHRSRYTHETSLADSNVKMAVFLESRAV